jgi:hypothetical protein
MSRSSGTWIALLLAVAAVALAIVYVVVSDESDAEEAHARSRRVQREEEVVHDRRLEGLREESGNLMPDALEGVALGLSRETIQRVRPAIRLKLEPGEPGIVFYDETLENGAQVVYGFAEGNDLLSQVQIMSILPPEAVAPHLQTMIGEYGTFTGIWDCPRTGDVPTRRFTWRRGETTIADIFLVYGNRVSVTFYIAPSDRIAHSLARAGCRPLQSIEELENFPVASIEQIQSAERGERLVVPPVTIPQEEAP